MRNQALLNVLWDAGNLTIDRHTAESFTVRGARLTVALQVQETALRSLFDRSGGLARGIGCESGMGGISQYHRERASQSGELYDVRDVASKSANNAARLAALFQVFEGAGGQSALRLSRVRAASRHGT